MNEIIWINNEIFSWVSRSIGGILTDKNSCLRAYEIWERSKSLIENNLSAFDLTDGISNLKRSFNQRLQLIENVYYLKQIDFKNKEKGYLELLEQYGIVRPFIMKKLLDIRNDIEHYDASPPESDRCKELLDAVWYFLKSTDSLVNHKREGADFTLYNYEDIETPYGFELHINWFDKGKLEISGWFPENILNITNKNSYSEIQIIDLHGPQEWADTKYHQDKSDTDKYIRGILTLKEDIKLKVLKNIINLI